jgi:hypothetical protein
MDRAPGAFGANLPPERRRAKLKLNPAKRTWAQAGRVRLSVTFRRTNSVAWCRDMAAAMFSVCIFGFSRCRPSVRRARSVAEMSQCASRARVGGRGVAPWPGDLASRFLFSAPARAMSCPRRVVWLMSQFASRAPLRVARRRASAGRFGFMFSVFSSGTGAVVSPPRSVAKRSHFASRPATGGSAVLIRGAPNEVWPRSHVSQNGTRRA